MSVSTQLLFWSHVKFGRKVCQSGVAWGYFILCFCMEVTFFSVTIVLTEIKVAGIVEIDEQLNESNRSVLLY